jgi:hypothetical protein
MAQRIERSIATSAHRLRRRQTRREEETNCVEGQYDDTADRQTNRQAGRQTGRQAGSQAARASKLTLLSLLSEWRVPLLGVAVAVVLSLLLLFCWLLLLLLCVHDGHVSPRHWTTHTPHTTVPRLGGKRRRRMITVHHRITRKIEQHTHTNTIYRGTDTHTEVSLSQRTHRERETRR